MVLKSFEERQKGRPFYLQGKDNPIRQVHDFVRNVNAEKKYRANAAKKANLVKEESKKKTNLKPNLTSKDKEDIRKENELSKVLTSSKKYKEVDAPGPNNKGKKVLQKVNGSGSKKSTPKSTVHTRHYKTGERLGVLTRRQRAKYDAEAAGRTFEGEVARHEKESCHGKKHKRETLYKASHRKKKLKVKPTTTPKKKNKILEGKSLEERKKISKAALKALEDK